MKSSNEIRVGIVVVAALLLMGAGYFFIRGLGWGAQTYYLQLDGPANISAGSDVRLQGVRIGQVTDVSLNAAQKPRLTIAIRRSRPPVQLLQSYEYSVRTSSLLGENYVDVRGPFQSPALVYAPGATIPAQTQAGFTEAGDQATALIADARDTIKELNTTLRSINHGVLAPQNQAKLTQALDGVVKLTQAAQKGFGKEGVRIAFGDPRAQRALNETLENSAAAARNLQSLTANAGGVLNQNKGQLRQLLKSLDTAANGTAQLTNSLNAVVNDSKLRENSTLTLNAIRRTSENFEQASANFKKLTGDPATQASLHNTLTTLEKTTAALLATAQSIEKLTTDETVQDQLRGTLATLNQTALTLQKTAEGFNNVVGDAQVQADLKASVADLHGTLAASRGAAERINSLLGGRRHRNSPAQAGGEKAQQRGYAPGGIDFTYRYLGQDRPDGARHFGDLTFNTELFGGPFRLGIANIGEGNDLTLQTGTFLGQNGALRYGLYRSKLGIGAEYHTGRFSLEGNLYDPNDRSYNAYLGYQLTPSFEILAGREKSGGVRTNAIGVRLTP